MSVGYAVDEKVCPAPQTKSKHYKDRNLCMFYVVDFRLLVDSMHLNNILTR